MSVLQLKENFNSDCPCHHLRPVALPLSSLQLRLQSLHVRPVDVRPVALTLVSSATQKILAVQAGCCPQVAVARHV